MITFLDIIGKPKLIVIAHVNIWLRSLSQMSYNLTSERNSLKPGKVKDMESEWAVFKVSIAEVAAKTCGQTVTCAF